MIEEVLPIWVTNVHFGDARTTRAPVLTIKIRVHLRHHLITVGTDGTVETVGTVGMVRLHGGM